MSTTTRSIATAKMSATALIDSLLARTLASAETSWPPQPTDTQRLLERAAYHSIAGLLLRAAPLREQPQALLHACLHRAQHISTPYIVNGVTYYGGDRLIWAHDFHLLAASLSAAEWEQLCQHAIAGGCAGVCLNGLEIAQARLGTRPPVQILERLRAVPAEAATRYLLDGRQVRRALMDLQAIPGLRRKLRFISMRLFPSAAFLRDKYPQMHKAPLLLLHLRRLLDFVLRRPDGAPH